MTRVEWLEERKKGLGASDAGSYLGCSPWKTNVELWEEKTGLRTSPEISNPAIDYGNAAEPLLRDLFTLDHPEYEVSYEPFNIIRHPDKPYIFATPDGELLERATGRRGGLEIKTTELRSVSAWAKWSDRIPDYYFAQVVHQMLATGWEFVILDAQLKYYTKDGELRKETREYHIERAEAADDLRYTEQQASRFWDFVQRRVRPALKLPPI
jgi:putative phage-type endonuclease